jgi:two-component system sensor histidine kinase UhpB
MRAVLFKSRWRRDLVGLFLWTGLGFWTAVSGNWSEWVSRFARHYEAWQMDEWPLGLLLLAVGLCVFVWRRLVELNALLVQNHGLLRRLMTVQEDERRSIARELHDEFGQGCTAIRLEAQCVQVLGRGALHQQALGDSARRIDQAAHGLYALVQNRLKELRPQGLDGLGLLAAVQDLCEQWERQAGVSCVFFSPSQPAQALLVEQEEDAFQVAVYRLVQESLTNVARHARASQVKVSMVVLNAPQTLCLEIQDDGAGWGNEAGPAMGFGLLGMQERAAALDGALALLRSSAFATGCLVRVTLPLKRAAA